MNLCKNATCVLIHAVVEKTRITRWFYGISKWSSISGVVVHGVPKKSNPFLFFKSYIL